MPADFADHTPTSLPTVSVIIPCYNAGLLLFRSLSSVFKQTAQPFEVIVVDDASTSDHAKLVQQYFPRVKYVRNEVNRGVAFSRNRGAAMAQGAYIAFLDADDAWTTNKLTQQLSEMTNADADLSFTGFRDVRRKSRHWGYRKLSGKYCDMLHAGLAFNASTFMIRRSTFLKIGGFREDLRRGEDINLFYRLALDDVCACYVPAALAWYFHDNETHLTGAQNAEISFAQLTNDLSNADPTVPENLDATLRAASRHFVGRYLADVAKGQTGNRLAREIASVGTGAHIVIAYMMSVIPCVLRRPLARTLLPFYRRRQQRHFWAQRQ